MRTDMQPEVTITWIGHASVLLEIDGFRILTDPIVTSRVAHLRRRVPLPEIDAVDAILVSHLHMDHLHLRSLHLLADGARLVAPLGSSRLFRSLPVSSLDEVVAGESLVLRDEQRGSPAIEVAVVPADHSNSRGPHSRVVAEPVGYIVRVGERAVYFAGDTDLFDAMREFPPIDVALLPIWGWGPTLGERHLDPDRAATATHWISPARVVPIHWGTYTPITARRGSPAWIEDPLAAFTAELRRLGLDDRLEALRPGGTTTTRSRPSTDQASTSPPDAAEAGTGTG
jgi:L-ascorbate metabolism protein UlaG (beta-lactamase superfamily)